MRFLNKFASVEAAEAPVLSYFILVLKVGQVRELHLFVQAHVVCWQVPGLLLLCAGQRLVMGRRMAAFHQASVHILRVWSRNKSCIPLKIRDSSCGNTKFLSLVLFKEVGGLCRRKVPFCQHLLFCCPGSGAEVEEEL